MRLSKAAKLRASAWWFFGGRQIGVRSREESGEVPMH